MQNNFIQVCYLGAGLEPQISPFTASFSNQSYNAIFVTDALDK
jgi:hypothetical protein